jgi:hypothetical protein
VSALFFRLYPLASLLLLTPAIPHAKKLRPGWMPFDESCVPALRTDRMLPVPEDRAAENAIASGP